MPIPPFVTRFFPPSTSGPIGNSPATGSIVKPSMGASGAQLPPSPTVAYQSRNVSSTVSKTKTSGRSGAAPQAALNAIGSSPSFTQTVAQGGDNTYALSAVSDYTAMELTLTTTATGNTATVDILNSLSLIQIIAPDVGPVINLQGGQVVTSGGHVTMADIYVLSQRFSEYGQSVTENDVTGATATGPFTYMVNGISLPASRGPYTLRIKANSTSGFSASTTALSVTYTIAFIAGTATHRFNYLSTLLVAQPTANGNQDQGPTATIQDKPLAELFIGGLAGHGDLAELQAVAAGNVMSFNSTGSQLASRSDAQLVNPSYAGVLYPALALGTAITVGRATVFLTRWSATPATSGVWAGYAWFD